MYIPLQTQRYSFLTGSYSQVPPFAHGWELHGFSMTTATNNEVILLFLFMHMLELNILRFLGLQLVADVGPTFSSLNFFPS